MNGQNNNIDKQYMLTQMDELQWLHYRRMETQKQLRKVRGRMKTNYESLTHRDEIPSDKWGKTAYLLSKSGTIVNGLRIGLKVGRAVNGLIKLRQLFSKKRR